MKIPFISSESSSKSSAGVTLRLGRISVISAAKVAFVWAIVVSIIGFIFLMTLYLVTVFTGVFNVLNGVSNDLVGSGANLHSFINPLNIVIWSLVMAVTNIFVITISTAICVAVYNLIAKLTGGLKITFYR